MIHLSKTNAKHAGCLSPWSGAVLNCCILKALVLTAFTVLTWFVLVERDALPRYRTIMAYPSWSCFGENANLFSNPDVEYNGLMAGDYEEHNNAQAIRDHMVRYAPS